MAPRHWQRGIKPTPNPQSAERSELQFEDDIQAEFFPVGCRVLQQQPRFLQFVFINKQWQIVLEVPPGTHRQLHLASMEEQLCRASDMTKTFSRKTKTNI